MDVIVWDFDGCIAPPYRPGPPAGPLNPLFRLTVAPCDWIVTGRVAAERAALSRLTGVREDHIIARDWESPPGEPDYLPRYREWKVRRLGDLIDEILATARGVTVVDDDEEIIARVRALPVAAAATGAVAVVRMIFQ